MILFSIREKEIIPRDENIGEFLKHFAKNIELELERADVSILSLRLLSTLYDGRVDIDLK